MQNPDIARLFDEVADLLEIQDANPFRVRAYRNAARTIRDFPEPIADRVRAGTKDLTDIAGIGDDLAEKITAIITTGELPLRKELASKLPAGLLDLLRIPGLGPKMEEKMRAGIGQAQVGERRLLLNEAEAQATAVVAYLEAGGGIAQIG